MPPLLRTLFLAALAALPLRETAAQTPATRPPAEVLVLGTYHFDNPGLDIARFTVADILSPQKQAEVAAVTDALARFRPTKIVVERRREHRATLDSLYAAYLDGRHTLGRSEVEQIGFRLAARLGHDRVYPADHEGTFPAGPVMAHAAEHDPASADAMMGFIRRIEQESDSLQQTATLAAILHHYNRPDLLRRDHGWYVSLAAIGDGAGDSGATLLSAWYERNVRIFAHIAAVAAPGERVLVIFGAGHAPILRELIHAAPGLTLVEPADHL